MKWIAFTGHRPKDLGDLSFSQFAEALDALGCDKRDDIGFIVGGALGTDTWAALYAQFHHIPYRLILPFAPSVMTQMWRPHDKEMLRVSIEKAVDVQIMSEKEYHPRYYHQRNEAMVDTAEVVFAVWNGRLLGGTANCIRYALSVDKPVYNLLKNGAFDGKLHPVRTIR